MQRRNFLKSVGGALSAVAVGGCVTYTATPTEVPAVAQVVDVQRHDDAVTAVIEVTNDGAEAGVVGLHIHYYSGDAVHHTHMRTVHVPAGQSETISDTTTHNPEPIDGVGVHVTD